MVTGRAEDINKLYSLDVFEGNQQFFVPDVVMTRADFAKAVVKACDIRVQEPQKRSTRRSSQENLLLSMYRSNTLTTTTSRNLIIKGSLLEQPQVVSAGGGETKQGPGGDDIDAGAGGV